MVLITYQDAIDYLLECSELPQGRIESSHDLILNAIRDETSKYLKYAAQILEQHKDVLTEQRRKERDQRLTAFLNAGEDILSTVDGEQ